MRSPGPLVSTSTALRRSPVGIKGWELLLVKGLTTYAGTSVVIVIPGKTMARNASSMVHHVFIQSVLCEGRDCEVLDVEGLECSVGQAVPVVWSCRSNGCGHHGDALACSHGTCRSLPRWISWPQLTHREKTEFQSWNFLPLGLATGLAMLTCPLLSATQTWSARRASALRVQPTGSECWRPCT